MGMKSTAIFRDDGFVDDRVELNMTTVLEQGDPTISDARRRIDSELPDEPSRRVAHVLEVAEHPVAGQDLPRMSGTAFEPPLEQRGLFPPLHREDVAFDVRLDRHRNRLPPDRTGSGGTRPPEMRVDSTAARCQA